MASVLLMVSTLIAGVCSVRVNHDFDTLDHETYLEQWSYHTIDFDRPDKKAAMPFTVDVETGQVTSVSGNISVEEGWFVHKLQHHYPWSIYRWEAMQQSEDSIAVTF